MEVQLHLGHTGGTHMVSPDRKHTITFDQCRLGQVVKKTTTLSTNLLLRHWRGMCCDHKPEEHRQRNTLMSSDLSRYTPGT